MPTFSTAIINRLVKYYGINEEDANAMVSDEWDYIEHEFIKNEITPQEMAKELISLYMVA